MKIPRRSRLREATLLSSIRTIQPPSSRATREEVQRARLQQVVKLHLEPDRLPPISSRLRPSTPQRRTRLRPSSSQAPTDGPRLKLKRSFSPLQQRSISRPRSVPERSRSLSSRPSPLLRRPFIACSRHLRLHRLAKTATRTTRRRARSPRREMSPRATKKGRMREKRRRMPRLR
jgi:hypothetical protein